MTITFRNTTRDIYRKFVRKFEKRQEPVTVTRWKSWSINHFLRFAILRPNVENTKKVNNAKKRTILCTKKLYMYRVLALKMTNINQQDVKTTSEVFLCPMSCLQIIGTLGARNFTCSVFFGTANTLPTLSHIQNSVVRNITFKNAVDHFLDQCSKISHF